MARTTKAKILKVEEATAYTRQVVWLELRETPGFIPVTFWAKNGAFHRYDREDRVEMIHVRAEYYGKTWRCWNMKPAETRDWKAI